MTQILKWAAVVGLFALAGGLVLFCPFKNIWWLTIASSILGLGTGAVLPSLNTLITSSAPKTERGLNKFQSLKIPKLANQLENKPPRQ